MDPFTVFSLVCGVVQIVDTSMEVATKCRELYKDGASSEDREIEEMAKNLMDLHRNLDPRAQDGPGELQDLFSKCSDTAQQLCTEVQKLKVNGPHRKREVVVQTVKAMWKRSTIEAIQKQLEGYQKLLDSNILVELRFVRHRSLFPVWRHSCVGISPTTVRSSASFVLCKDSILCMQGWLVEAEGKKTLPEATY